MQLNKVNLGLGGGSFTQIAHRSHVQMMSYLIETSNGKIIMIDGGYYCKEDAENMYHVIREKGGHVDLWFISHAHEDHHGALTWMMEHHDNFDITIDKLCFYFPSMDWLSHKEAFEYNIKFFNQIEKHNINVVTPKAGEYFKCDDIDIEIISVPEDYESYSSINGTSMIMLVHFPKRDILFLGDFDVDGQDEFLRKHDVSKIRKDIVQMAHHGQDGVDRSFYELIMPKICLYPTPKWLWENNMYGCNNPETVGKGSFKTLETRKWMKELGVKESYTHEFGDYLFY